MGRFWNIIFGIVLIGLGILYFFPGLLVDEGFFRFSSAVILLGVGYLTFRAAPLTGRPGRFGVRVIGVIVFIIGLFQAFNFVNEFFGLGVESGLVDLVTYSKVAAGILIFLGVILLVLSFSRATTATGIYAGG